MHLVGVDLGQTVDRAAISIIERSERLQVAPNVPGQYRPENDKTISHYRLMHLEEAPQGTPYPVIVRRIKTIMEIPELMGRAILVIDYTGVGHPVYDMMIEAALSPIKITTTKGYKINEEDKGYSVPKQDIVTVLQVLLQTGRFEYTKKLKLAERFEEQMREFRIKMDKRTAHVRYENLTDDIHDDTVISVALPVWYAERTMGGMRDIRTKNEERSKRSSFNPLDYAIGG